MQVDCQPPWSFEERLRQQSPKAAIDSSLHIGQAFGQICQQGFANRFARGTSARSMGSPQEGSVDTGRHHDQFSQEHRWNGTSKVSQLKGSDN
jgi:hypothetical protein